MTEIVLERTSTEKRETRAKSIAAMGLVNREKDKFRVSTPSLRGKQTSYEVRRDRGGKIRCTCLEYEEAAVTNPGFRCEHIIAVKYALLAKNTEPVTKQTVKAETQIEIKPPRVVSEDRRLLESSADLGINQSETKMSEDGEQTTVGIAARVSEKGRPETDEAEFRQIMSTQGENKMKSEISREIPFIRAGEAADENFDLPNNVLNFTSTLKELRKDLDPNLVKQREGWRDRNGNTHYVDYVEWHTVADILDENAPNWSHAVRDIRQIGDIFAVTVAITIDGVTREGIGTGTAESELGIKKAEHDALKRAAVKFGIARDLYKREYEMTDRDGPSSAVTDDAGFPSNPIARSLSDLVTAKQLGMIRAISREIGVDANKECIAVMHCKTDELSRKAASGLIGHLQELQKHLESETNAALRHAS